MAEGKWTDREIVGENVRKAVSGKVKQGLVGHGCELILF